MKNHRSYVDDFPSAVKEKPVHPGPARFFVFHTFYPHATRQISFVLMQGFGRKAFDNETLVGYFPHMESLFAIPGYPALFILSFLASTLLPLGSEWLLIVMLLGKYDPPATVAVASVGNLLGACTTWAVGLYGGPFLIRRILRIDAAAQAKAERFYGRYGFWSLLLSWLPFIGDPLCLAAGILRMDLGRFAALVFAGKLARYAAVAWLTLSGASFFGSFGF